MDHAQGRASKGTKVDSRSRSSVPFRHPSLIHHLCFSTAAPCQRHVHRSGANRARNPEQPRSIEKGSAGAPVGVRLADCQQGDRSVHGMTAGSFSKLTTVFAASLTSWRSYLLELLGLHAGSPHSSPLSSELSFATNPLTRGNCCPSPSAV
jgi:hypothetical protein